MTTWLDQALASLDDGGWIGNVFHHFHTGDYIVLSCLFLRQLFNGNLAVLNILYIILLCM